MSARLDKNWHTIINAGPGQDTLKNDPQTINTTIPKKQCTKVKEQSEKDDAVQERGLAEKGASSREDAVVLRKSQMQVRQHHTILQLSTTDQSSSSPK